MFNWFEKLVEPFPNEPAPGMPNGAIGFLWASTRGMRVPIVITALLTGGIGVFEAFLYGSLGRVVDVLSRSSPQDLWRTQNQEILGLGAILLASTLLIGVQNLVKQQALSGNFAMRLRWNFHRRMLAQNVSAFQGDLPGRVAARVMETAVAVRDAWILLMDMFVFLVIYLATIGFVVGSFDVALLMPLGCWLIATAVAVAYFLPRLEAAATAQADASLLTTGRITDTYSNFATVKLFSHTGHEAAHARGAMLEFMASIRHQLRLVTSFDIISHAMSMGLIIGTLGMAFMLWTDGHLSIGSVAAAGAMSLRLNGMSNTILWQTASLFEHIGTMKVGIGALSQEPTVVDNFEAQPLRVAGGEVVFERVAFWYDAAANERRGPILQDFDLRVEPGERVGLVGRSGAGKSTIMNLLLRLHDVNQGRILIDGQDIAAVTQDSLRAQIGMVTQETSLLHRSIRDNILYGDPHASEQAMIEAAKRAGAHEFIVGLSDQQGRRGYDAHVGDRGAKLSGGQRQRIGIARMMLKNAPIVLLDEATSALDSEIETTILQSLYRFMAGRTIIAIAHRLSTIAAMDRLIVLDRGRIVEQGSHDALLARDGLYARLWAHHSGGRLLSERRSCN